MLDGPSVHAVSYSMFLQFIAAQLLCSLAGFELTFLVSDEVLGGLLVMRLDRLRTMGRTVFAAKQHSLHCTSASAAFMSIPRLHVASL